MNKSERRVIYIMCRYKICMDNLGLKKLKGKEADKEKQKFYDKTGMTLEEAKKIVFGGQKTLPKLKTNYLDDIQQELF